MGNVLVEFSQHLLQEAIYWSVGVWLLGVLATPFALFYRLYKVLKLPD